MKTHERKYININTFNSILRNSKKVDEIKSGIQK